MPRRPGATPTERHGAPATPAVPPGPGQLAGAPIPDESTALELDAPQRVSTVAFPATPADRAAPAPATTPSLAGAPVAHRPNGDGEDAGAERTATAPQLRRFIKSRAYVPMHELRRRFAINGGDDEVTPVDLEKRRVFVGLPEREGRLLGELLRGGDIGYELSLDPISPIVVGVYPMRPVTRA